MVGFILRKWKYLEKEFGTYRDGFNNWKDKMRAHFKNKRGRKGLDIPEVKAKREIYGARKGHSAGNGLTDFKRVCVMWGEKNFLPPREKVKTRRQLQHMKNSFNIKVSYLLRSKISQL